ncbi:MULTISPECIES: YrdB family protein [Tabrizicola]|uniref:YrdB family protein n=1 Tax=Tabrizicola TaxID=1443919 RepID=UPI0010809A63|nr:MULTISPECIES: YrdB family protein [Paracoccaceae]
MLTLVNGALAFAVEMALLAGVGRATYLTFESGPAGWLIAAMAIAGVTVVWGLWAAPASPRRLDPGALLALKAGLFLLGTLAWRAGGPGWAWPLFAGAAALSLILGLADRP